MAGWVVPRTSVRDHRQCCGIVSLWVLPACTGFGAVRPGTRAGRRSVFCHTGRIGWAVLGPEWGWGQRQPEGATDPRPSRHWVRVASRGGIRRPFQDPGRQGSWWCASSRPCRKPEPGMETNPIPDRPRFGDGQLLRPERGEQAQILLPDDHMVKRWTLKWQEQWWPGSRYRRGQIR